MRAFESREVMWAAAGVCLTALIAIGGIALAFGAKTPQQVMGQTQAQVDAMSLKLSDHEVRISVLEALAKETHDGVEELVGHSLRKK